MSQLTPETEESRAHEQPQGAAPSSAPTLGTRRRLTTPQPQLCNESCGFSQNPKHHLRRTTRRSPALHPIPSPPQSQPHQNYFCSPNLSRTSAAPDLRPPTGHQACPLSFPPRYTRNAQPGTPRGPPESWAPLQAAQCRASLLTPSHHRGSLLCQQDPSEGPRGTHEYHERMNA